MLPRQCVSCGQEIKGPRAHKARYCSKACKQFAYRMAVLKRHGRYNRRADSLVDQRHRRAGSTPPPRPSGQRSR